ncbi:TIGR03571 family LLM class oxidoreductase [Corynebacterium sp.]|uniref:TIGR03571 family LLM class oxidoreductase n=1 Tax=Corynebacterium sp. TaxID=1720 RepID=UPI003B3B5F15
MRRTFAEGELTLGLGLPVGGDPEDVTRQVALVRAAEEAGVAAVWARDIPLRVDTFGDVGQVHDPFMYLTWLAAHTETIALGTAAVVLPLAHPLLLAKRSAGLDRLSGGRFLMGVASGDRPEEFPAFGMEKGERAAVFRENLEVLEAGWSSTGRPVRWSRGRMGGADVVPKPTAGRVPVLPTGSCQQNMDYNAAHGDGWITYHRPLPQQKVMVDRWRASCRDGFRPFAESMWVDLAEDPGLPVEGRDSGYRTGRDGLSEILHSQRSMGVNHVSLQLRSRDRTAEDMLAEVATYVLPEFPALYG